MIGPAEREGEFNFADILDFLQKYKKPILVITLAAGVLSMIFSMPYFIPPKYKSRVIIYPTRTNSISRSLLGTTADQHDILAFGEEEEAEQLLQILESDEITERIAKRYELMEHYGIDPKGDYPKTRLDYEFKENVKYRRTEYMSIEITVLDTDPEKAANMANDIATLLDSVKTHIQQTRAKEALAIVKQQYEAKEQRTSLIVDSLKKLGELGVQNYEEQPAVITEQYAKARLEGNVKVAEEMREMEKALAKYGPIHQKLSDELESDVNQLTDLEAKYHQAETDAEQALSHKFVINKAVPAEKKSYPVRSLIILISMASAMTGSILIFAIISNYKKFRNRKALFNAVQEQKRYSDVEV